MTVFNPDNTILNIKNALANIAATQISGVTRTYAEEPDGPPEDGSVVVGSPQFRIEDNTSGKIKVRFKFPVSFLTTRRGQGEDLVLVESYFGPFLLAFNSWANQNLDTDAYQTETDSGGVAQVIYAQQTMRALVVNVSVVTEFNIPLS